MKTEENAPPSLRRKIFGAGMTLAGILLGILLVLFLLIDAIPAYTVSWKGLWPVLLAVAAVLITAAVLLSLWLSRKLTDPLRKIDPGNPEKGVPYAELQPMTDEIRQQNAKLLRQMQEQTALHDEQDAMRREFTANVSHELKTPLTSISGYAELIRDGIARPEDLPRFAERIYDESHRMITLVGDIIKLSQLDEKEVNVPTEELDLWELCEGIIDQLQLPASKRNISLRLEGERLTIRSAGQIVEEILFNLCDNAVKYNKEGGSVTVTLRRCVDGAEVCVADTGIGIPEENLSHVFERFYRVDKSHSKEIGGTGLGLSIVKHGAAYLDARVSLESKEGDGTTVRVLF